MRFFKQVDNGYIVAIGTGTFGNISEEEYNIILSIIHNKPPRTETTDYRLREDLTWEEYEIPPMPEPEPDAEEILNILMGVDE